MRTRAGRKHMAMMLLCMMMLVLVFIPVMTTTALADPFDDIKAGMENGNGSNYLGGLEKTTTAIGNEAFGFIRGLILTVAIVGLGVGVLLVVIGGRESIQSGKRRIGVALIGIFAAAAILIVAEWVWKAGTNVGNGDGTQQTAPNKLDGAFHDVDIAEDAYLAYLALTNENKL